MTPVAPGTPDPPPRTVDWGDLTPRLQPGDRVCVTHGRITTVQAPIRIPVCPHCGQLALAVRFGPSGPNRFEEPIPPHCDAPERHPLAGGAVEISWTPCGCDAAQTARGGHRAWRCSACTTLGRTTAVLHWPPCSRVPGTG